MANKLTSIQNSGTNNYLNPLKAVTKLATDLLIPGVVGTITSTGGIAPSTGSMAVNAQGSPNMSVAVNQGNLYVNATPTGDVAQNFSVNQDVAENVTISSNASGSTRFDFVYMTLDPNKLINPAVTGLDAATLITSRSTTNYNAADLVAFGNSNGAQANTLLLAVVTVVNGAVSITNANIADVRSRLAISASSAGAGQVRSSISTALPTTGTVSLDPTIGSIFTVTPTGAITLNAVVAPIGAWITIVITTSGASSFSVTPTTNFKTTGALATGTVTGKVFTLSFFGDGTNMNEVARTVAM